MPWYFPSKVMSVHVPNGRCASRISIWRDDMGTNCLPTIPLGFSANMSLFSKISVIFPAVRNASATFRHMYHYRWNRLCHGDSSSLVWLFCIAAVTWGWCDFSRLMWLKYGACSAQIYTGLHHLASPYHIWFSSPTLLPSYLHILLPS